MYLSFTFQYFSNNGIILKINILNVPKVFFTQKLSMSFIVIYGILKSKKCGVVCWFSRQYGILSVDSKDNIRELTGFIFSSFKQQEIMPHLELKSKFVEVHLPMDCSAAKVIICQNLHWLWKGRGILSFLERRHTDKKRIQRCSV